MNQAELETRTDKLFSTVMDLYHEARKQGNVQTDHFFLSIAYTLGSLIPNTVEPVSIGPLTARVIDAFTTGLQTGAQVAKIPGELTVIRGSI